MAQLRTDMAARLLLERLLALGPMIEAEAVDVLDSRAPGRAHEILGWAYGAGMIRRVQADDTVLLEAVGAPQTLAA